MKLTMRVVTVLAALSGHPIRFSKVAAPDRDPDSVAITPDPRAAIGSVRGLRSHKSIPYVGKLRMDLLAPQGSGPHPLVL